MSYTLTRYELANDPSLSWSHWLALAIGVVEVEAVRTGHPISRVRRRMSENHVQRGKRIAQYMRVMMRGTRRDPAL